MPRQRRQLSKTKTYHIMIRGNQRQNIFLDEEDKTEFIEILKKKKVHQEYLLYAYCLMNNHVHLLLQEDQDELSSIMKKINVSYVYYFNRKYLRIGHLFQDRFKSEAIEKENYLLATISYIHNNSVQAQIVKNPKDYQWSSYNQYVNPEETDFSLIIERTKVLSLFSSNEKRAIQLFIEYHTKPKQEHFLEYPKEEIKNLLNEKEAEQLISQYLIQNNLSLENLREKIYKNTRKELIRKLKEKSNLSTRKIASILRLNANIVQRIK